MTDSLGVEAGSKRVDRGGSWDYSAMLCRSANRSNGVPSGRYGSLGFRLALSFPSVRSPEAEQGAEPAGAGTEGARR